MLNQILISNVEQDIVQKLKIVYEVIVSFQRRF